MKLMFEHILALKKRCVLCGVFTGLVKAFMKSLRD